MNNNYSTSSLYSIDNLTYKEYANLSVGIQPHYTGWKYHIRIQDILDRLATKYEGASRDFFYFLSNENNVKGYDIKLYLPNGKTLKVETKARYINYNIFPKSFFLEFYSKDCDIMVINNPFVLTYWQRRLLAKKGIKLMSTSEFEVYISKLSLRMANTDNVNSCNMSMYFSYLCNNISILSISTLDKWLENGDKPKQKQENGSGDFGSQENGKDTVNLLKMSQEEEKEHYRIWPKKKKRKGILKLCERCGSNFVSYHGESLCRECQEEGEDDSTRTFGTPLDGLREPY